jgi:hypothetical protein
MVWGLRGCGACFGWFALRLPIPDLACTQHISYLLGTSAQQQGVHV